MELHDVVATSEAVAATRSRTAKVELLVAALRAADPDDRAALVSFLSGEPRQERLDLGPSAVFGTEAPAAPVSTLTVADVDAAFAAIADVPAGTGSRTARIGLLRELLADATEQEQGWLRKLAVRELRQGSLAGLLTAAIAVAAEVDEQPVRRAAMLSGSLVRTAQAALGGGTAALEAFRLQVGTALEPMLAATADDVATAVEAATPDGRGDVVVEAKLDGARLQIHRDGDEIRLFTRNLRDVTHRMPEIVAAVRALPVSAVVLDAEALSLDEDGRPRAFQDTMSRVGREHEVDGHAFALTLRCFDVLHLDGDDVLDLPLRERLRVLERAVPAELRVDQLLTDDPQAAERFAAETLAAGHEGVMVKALDAPYEAGRRGSSWRKVKPVHTLDLVVLAAEWGSGRRRGWLSNLHLGARAEGDDPVDVVAEDGTGYVMVGKTFKGLTDRTLTWQTEALQQLRIERPDGYARSDAEEHRAVHVRPELVVEIALDGLVRSTRYAGGLALRFARVRGYRQDKRPEDADDLSHVRVLAVGPATRAE